MLGSRKEIRSNEHCQASCGVKNRIDAVPTILYEMSGWTLALHLEISFFIFTYIQPQVIFTIYTPTHNPLKPVQSIIHKKRLVYTEHIG